MPCPPAPNAKLSLDEILPRLRCPWSGGALERRADVLVSADGSAAYPLTDEIPDLRVPPARLRIDLPWYEPWEELDALRFEPPAPLPAADLPYHLDAHQAAVAGAAGDGRWILEVGCGERRSEAYFAARGFRYVGVDVDRRGIGPHLLADAHNLPFTDASFDLYVSLAVYEHLASPLLAALEARRLLAPGGLFFGSAAFMYGFHDRASFHHMSHAGLLWTLRSAGFRDVRIWPDWSYTDSISQWGFRGRAGLPWRAFARGALTFAEWSFTRSSNLVRRLAGKRPLDLAARRTEIAGSLSFAARNPGPGEPH